MHSHDVIGGSGTRLHVDETGIKSGRSILFINGFSTSGHGWVYQMESDLGDDFRLATIDTRGHGRSDKPEGAYDDPELWADDIQAVIDALSLDDPILVATSLAGVYVCDYLSVHGEADIAGINLVGALTSTGTEDSIRKTGQEFIELVPQFESNDAKEAFRGIDEVWRRIPQEELSERDHYFLVGASLQTPPHVRRALLDRTVSYEDFLPTIESPVLVTHGQEDTIVLPAAAKDHAETIPNAQKSFYRDIGHAPFLEATSRFNQELREFVSSI